MTIEELEQRLLALENKVLANPNIIANAPKASVTLLKVFSFVSAVLGVAVLTIGFLPATYGVAFAGAAPLLLALEKILNMYLVDNGVTPPVSVAANVQHTTELDRVVGTVKQEVKEGLSGVEQGLSQLLTVIEHSGRNEPPPDSIPPPAPPAPPAGSYHLSTPPLPLDSGKTISQ